MSASNTSGKYIVVFKKDVPKSVVNKHADDVNAGGGTVGHRYDTVLNGFSASIPDDYLRTLSANEHVDSIEPDGVVTTCAKELGIGKRK